MLVFLLSSAVFLFFFQIKASLQPHIKYIKASQFGSTVWPGFYLVRITVRNLANWRIVLSTWCRSALKIHWKKVRSEKSLTRPWRKNSIVGMVLWKFPPCRQPTDRFVQHHSAVMQTLAFDLFTKSLPRTNQIPLFARKFNVYSFLQYTFFFTFYTLYIGGGGGGAGKTGVRKKGVRHSFLQLYYACSNKVALIWNKRITEVWAGLWAPPSPPFPSPPPYYALEPAFINTNHIFISLVAMEIVSPSTYSGTPHN